MANTLKFGNGEWYGKKDTILAYNDLNSNYKPLPFDFSRGSYATRVNKDGLIETVGSGQPRIDYKDDSKGAMLLEPSRTNLLPYSEDFSTFSLGANTEFISSSILSPSGELNAYKYKSINSIGNTFIIRNVGVSDNTTYTFSVWARADNPYNITVGKLCALNMTGGGQYNFVNISELTTEWKRFSITGTSGVSSTAQCFLATDWNVGGEIEFWGAQLEQESYATSYIPTQGGVVTRLQDSCSQSVPDGVIGQTEGSIYSEFKCLDSITNLILWMRDPSGGNYGDMIKLEVNINNVFQLEIREGDQNSTNIISNTLTVGNYYKVAVGYKQNDYVVYINGVQIGTDNTGNVPTCTEMYVGKYIDGGIRMGVSKDLKLYNTRLSNAELQALTSN